VRAACRPCAMLSTDLHIAQSPPGLLQWVDPALPPAAQPNDRALPVLQAQHCARCSYVCSEPSTPVGVLCRCLRTLAVRSLATIVTVAAGDRASHGLLSLVLQHGMAEALLSALEASQHRRESLIVVRSWAVRGVPLSHAFGAKREVQGDAWGFEKTSPW